MTFVLPPDLPPYLRPVKSYPPIEWTRDWAAARVDDPGLAIQCANCRTSVSFQSSEERERFLVSAEWTYADMKLYCPISPECKPPGWVRAGG